MPKPTKQIKPPKVGCVVSDKRLLKAMADHDCFIYPIPPAVAGGFKPSVFAVAWPVGRISDTFCFQGLRYALEHVGHSYFPFVRRIGEKLK